MTRLRLIIFTLTIVVVGIVSYITILYARGYRFDTKDNKIEPGGLLVLKSEPDGAQIIIDGKLESATNTTISLTEGSYDVMVKKEGYMTWSKRLTIKKEEVTETTAHLFRTAPSLTPITFNGAVNPVISNDLSKIAFVIPIVANDLDHNESYAGLWVMENANLPIGFSREPRRVVDGNLENFSITWSTDDRKIMLESPRSVFLVSVSEFTSQNQLRNIIGSVDEIKEEWSIEHTKRLDSQLKKLPSELQIYLRGSAKAVSFSADEDMVLYTASVSAELKDELIPSVPGSSTQKQDRKLQPYHTYIYDIEEDRNFLIDEDASDLVVGNKVISDNEPMRRLAWFPTSRHLILAEDNKLTIMDYDGTNRHEVYKGSFITPHAFPTLSLDRVVILTNLGASDSTPNLYSLSVK